MAIVVLVLLATGVFRTGATEPSVGGATFPAGAAGSPESQGSINDIYERTRSSVVFIQARVARHRQTPFGIPEPRQGLATGSGFVLDSDGTILTNAHVVQGASAVAVRFDERQELVNAELVGADLSTDLAVLRVDPGRARLAPLRLADSSKVRVGQPVIAIGNPFGFDDTVTTGIVSALQRQISAPNRFTIDNVIQTDASINPGNSGGPLLNAAGEVIGVNSQIASPGGGSVGIGFAVPSDTAKIVVPDLKDDGRVERPFLGVTTAPVTAQLGESMGLPVANGALVQTVVEGSPADRAGLRGGRTRVAQGLVLGGDLIVRVDGRDIATPQDVAAAIADNRPGQRVAVEYLRGDERRSTSVELGRRPNASAEEGTGGPDEGLPFPFP